MDDFLTTGTDDYQNELLNHCQKHLLIKRGEPEGIGSGSEHLGQKTIRTINAIYTVPARKYAEKVVDLLHLQMATPATTPGVSFTTVTPEDLEEVSADIATIYRKCVGDCIFSVSTGTTSSSPPRNWRKA